MDAFLEWFNRPSDTDPLTAAALTRLRLVTIHPFDDGNGRIARAVSDMCLTRSGGTRQRFHSISAQVHRERNAYCPVLEQTQRVGPASLPGSPDSWVAWNKPSTAPTHP